MSRVGRQRRDSHVGAGAVRIEDGYHPLVGGVQINTAQGPEGWFVLGSLLGRTRRFELEQQIDIDTSDDDL